MENLIFCYGNIISDAAIAFFAIFIWFREREEKKVTSFIAVLKYPGLTEVDILTISTAMTLLERSLLDEVRLSNNDKQKLITFMDSLQFFSNLNYLLLSLFILGVCIQVFAFTLDCTMM